MSGFVLLLNAYSHVLLSNKRLFSRKRVYFLHSKKGYISSSQVVSGVGSGEALLLGKGTFS